MNVLLYIIIGIMAVAGGWWFIRHQRKLRLRAHLMQEAIRNKDFTFRMPTDGMIFGERAMQETLNQLGETIRQQVSDHWEGADGIALPLLGPEAAKRYEPALWAEYMDPGTSAIRKYEIVDEVYSLGFTLPYIKGLNEQYKREIRELRDIIDEKPGKMVGNSGEMRTVYKQIKACAGNDAPALIYGNDGTGKELTARTIAELSPRKGGPFTVLGCANLRESFGNPASAFESELFGYERGAFLGANTRHIGKAEVANGGTLFLDDVSALGLPDQEKLLRFMQGQTFNRLGGNMQLHSDVRIIASSSKNLEEMMQQKLFREDLFYRLNIVQITLPDLAQRKSDILLLAEHFIAQVNLKYGRHVMRLSTPAIDMLMSYHWPGNVQELENCIERAALATTDDCIHSHDLPPTLQTDVTSKTSIIPEGGASLETLLESYEREILTEALRRNNGNLSAAGRDLSVSPRMMHYKVKKFGI